MEPLAHRPLAIFTLSFVCAGFAGIFFPTWIRWVLISLSGVLFLLCLLPFSHRLPPSVRKPGRLLFCGLLCGGLLLSLHTDLILVRPERNLDQPSVLITGVIRERKYTTSYSASYILRVTDGIPGGGTILLETADTSLSPGDEICCSSELSAFAENSGDFAEKRYYYALGVSLRGEAQDIEKTGTRRTGAWEWFAEFRSGLSARLQVSLGRRDAALPAALFLGDRSQLSDTLTRDMQRLGISHMLAISGQHFTILLGAAEYILKAVFPSKKPRTLILAGLCVFYMVLAGLSESVLRAGLMLLITYTAALLRRESDFYTSLGLSAALICLCSPSSFYSVGLQLSVASVAVLGCAVRLQEVVFRKTVPHPRLRKILFAFLLPLLVQLGLLPLLCLYFGEASLITPLAAVLFSPLVTLLLYLTPLLLLMQHLSPLAEGVQFLVQCTTELAELLAGLRNISIPLNYALCPLFGLLLSGTLLSTGFLRRRRQMIAALCTSGILLLGFGGYLGICMAVSAQQNTVISVQAKNNDALIVLSRGKTLLCDISDGSYRALDTFYDTVRAQHATEVEVLMLTHLHNRHIHSFTRLCGRTYVRNLLLPQPVTESEKSVADSLCKAAEEQGIPVTFYEASAHPSVRFGETELLPGPRSYLSRSTHPVITIRIQCGNQSVQYLGTSWNETNECPNPADAQILILGAHGPIYKSFFLLPQSQTSWKILIRGKSGEFAENLPDSDTITGAEPVRIPFAEGS